MRRWLIVVGIVACTSVGLAQTFTGNPIWNPWFSGAGWSHTAAVANAGVFHEFKYRTSDGAFEHCQRVLVSLTQVAPSITCATAAVSPGWDVMQASARPASQTVDVYFYDRDGGYSGVWVFPTVHICSIDNC